MELQKLLGDENRILNVSAAFRNVPMLCLTNQSQTRELTKTISEEGSKSDAEKPQIALKICSTGTTNTRFCIPSQAYRKQALMSWTS